MDVQYRYRVHEERNIVFNLLIALGATSKSAGNEVGGSAFRFHEFFGYVHFGGRSE